MEQRIVEKAQELFFRYGLKSVTMDDIASNLGASKKTIYQYFKDKDHLVDAVVQREIEQDMHECTLITCSCNNAVQEVLNDGVYGFVQKPYRIERLLDAVSQALQEKNSPYV